MCCSLRLAAPHKGGSELTNQSNLSLLCATAVSLVLSALISLAHNEMREYLVEGLEGMPTCRL